MTSFRKLVEWIKGSPPVDMRFEPSIAAPHLGWVGLPIEPDECYIELYVESLRLTQARRLATTFHGVVSAFASLPRQGEPNAEFAAVTKPERLIQLDSKALDKVITVSKRIVGPVAWRGGTLSLELGLFSVKSENFLGTVLDYVTKVSAAAGVSFVGVVKPFLPLITEGMDLIAGQTEDTAIEVGIFTDMNLTASGVHAIIATPKNTVPSGKVALDPSDGKLLLDGVPLQHGYCVFSIRRVNQKADYGEIPELREKYAVLQTAIRDDDVERAKDAFTAFRLAAIVSPDLISSDANKLIAKAQQKLKEAFPGGGISKDRPTRQVEELSAIGLYE